ncbi:HNH endonuclease [Kribbella sp. NBC_01505]|uniref:HNH endonuclease signature motif containing protein n=1 Tax=Kribbella sp. NBC_01505 TaxID=2903580 RepID=UPI00386BA21F
MEILAMPPVYMQSGGELLSTLDTLMATAALVETLKLQVMGRLDEIGTAQELGARDTTELLAQRYRLVPTDVRKDLTFAKNLPKYSAVADALPEPADPSKSESAESSGSAVLAPDSAKVIVSTLEKAPATVPVEVLDVAEREMIRAAEHTNIRELAKFGRDVLARLDTDGPEPAEDEAHKQRSLRLRDVEGGVKITGFLPGAAGEQVKTQIHTLAKPHKTIDGERDPRTLEQRQADALMGISDAAAGNPDYPGVPHLTVTIDFNDLKNALSNVPDAFNSAAGASGAAGAAGATGANGANGANGATDATGATGGSGGMGELVFGGNLSAGAVRLLACDAAILPIVLGGDSQPLDVGTEQRFVNRYIRRALNKRDKGCVVCKAPPWMCHAHHVIHWVDGGPTSLQNLALVCSAHHRAVHKNQWTITISGGVVHVTRPSWADPPPPDPVALAAMAAWVTPVRNTDATASTSGHAGGASAATASATSAGGAGARVDDVSRAHADDAGTGSAGSASASEARADEGSASRASASRARGDEGGADTASDSRARVDVDEVSGARFSWGDAGSDPMYEQPARLPAASALPNAALVAAREAFRERLIALAPGYTDPWGTDDTPAAGP